MINISLRNRHVLFGRNWGSATIIGLLTSLAVCGDAAAAETFVRVDNISVPGISATNPFLFDLATDHTLFSAALLVSDASNKSLDVFSAYGENFLYSVPGFTGVTTLENLGPTGVVAVNFSEAYVGDGNSTVQVVNLFTGTITASINTGGVNHADEGAFDFRDQEVLFTNPAETVPFASLISTRSHKVLKQFTFSAATAGLEQPVYSPRTGLFYMPVPVLNNNPSSGEVAVINPKTLTIGHPFPVSNCAPAGMAIGPFPQLLLGCTASNIQIMDITNGNIIATIDSIGGADEVAYNPGDNNYYITTHAFSPNPGPELAVVNASTLSLVAVVPTGPFAHAVAVNPVTNDIFVPIGVPIFGGTPDPACPNGCIAVFEKSTTH